MSNCEQLRQILERIDGRGYKSYKDVAGAYTLGELKLLIDYVQGDPFAAPSRLRARLPAAVAAFPEWAVRSRIRRTATADFLTRAFDAALTDRRSRVHGTGKSGLIAIDAPAQEVLERTSVVVHGEEVEARFVVGLPARGRTVLGRQAAILLLEELPRVIEAALRFKAIDGEQLRRHVESVEDQEALRAGLSERGLIAFVGDGSSLPRRSGVDPRPLGEGTVELEAPDELAVELELPNRGRVRGLGIPEGVTLIVGGGYHGKSTLLRALELGIYNHLPGDGRELVATRRGAVKIRAEDGRRVERVDISPFISNLPLGRDTAAFSTDDASGSTSQAANIVEALEVGAEVLLMDEDTSATNFMIRDHRMQALVAKEKEPITPFIDKVRQLHRDRGVSSVLVVGGVGDYFDVADTVIMMDEYRPRDVTAAAREIADRYRELRRPEGGDEFGPRRDRLPLAESLDPSRGRREVKVDVKGLHTLRFGAWTIDLRGLEQLVETAQTRALARALLYLREHLLDGGTPLAEALDQLDAGFVDQGLDLLARGRDGGLAEVRRFEIAAALNRLRSVKVR